MANLELFRAMLEGMVDPKHRLVVLAKRIPWSEIEERIAPLISRTLRSEKSFLQGDLFSSSLQVASVRGWAFRPSDPADDFPSFILSMRSMSVTNHLVSAGRNQCLGNYSVAKTTTIHGCPVIPLISVGSTK